MSGTDISIDNRDVLAAAGRSWGLLLFVGILTLGLGVMFVAWPGATALVVAALFGFYLLISGVFSLVQSFAQEEHRALLAISGILSIILAVLFFKSENSVAILGLFIGFAWLFRGITELIVGLQSSGVDGRGWLITSGVLLILGAIVVFVYPGLALGTLVWVTGIMLIVLGVSEIVGAFQVKKLAGV